MLLGNLKPASTVGAEAVLGEVVSTAGRTNRLVLGGGDWEGTRVRDGHEIPSDSGLDGGHISRAELVELAEYRQGGFLEDRMLIAVVLITHLADVAVEVELLDSTVGGVSIRRQLQPTSVGARCPLASRF